MATPNPLEPVKGAGTTLWVYNGKGDAYANPLSDDDWQRLAKVKDLTPGEMTAEPYDDNYLDDEDADWTATGQGQKSAGDTSFTLAWKPGEEGQKGLIGWFESGDVRAYKIRFPNGTVDVFRGWVSSIGKAVTAKEVITRTVKVTNVGKPSVAEERSEITPATAIKVTPTSGTVAKGKTTTLTVSFEPESATDKTFRAVSADPSKATISVKDMDEDADWTATGQGQKSAGDTSFTLAWKPGEEGQKGLIGWFESGDVRAYKIRFPNGTVDVFRGWVSSIGKAVTAKEVITRTVKVTNVGKPSVAEERSKITPVTAIKVTPTSGTVAKGKTTTLTVSFEPESATDKTFRAVSADPSKATISVKDMTITVNGVATGKVQIPVVSGNGQFAAVAEVTVTEAGAAG
ncbi:phage major tail protein [Escherichia coli]|nr:phage major tail protein [Escherichia coli]